MSQYDHVKTTQHTLIINLDIDVMYVGEYADNTDWIAEQHKDIITNIKRSDTNIKNVEIEDVER